MLINTNRVLLDITNSTNSESRKLYTLTELIAFLCLISIIFCFCWLNYEKSIEMLENDKRIASLDIQRHRRLRHINSNSNTEIQQAQL